MTLDERRVGHLEGDGHGDQLISASNTGRNGPCLHSLKSQWLLLIICWSKEMHQTHTQNTNANYNTYLGGHIDYENTTYFYPAYTYTNTNIVK